MAFKPPTPGQMNRPVTIQSRSTSQSASGGSTPSFSSAYIAQAWARDEGSRSMWEDNQAGKMRVIVYHTYTIRYDATVRSGLYVDDPDYGDPMIISGVIDPEAGRKRFMQLTCIEQDG